jgi:hypothetical protein
MLKRDRARGVKRKKLFGEREGVRSVVAGRGPEDQNTKRQEE